MLFNGVKVRPVKHKPPVCPDCKDIMVKAWIECEDGSGWYCAWLCGCKIERLTQDEAMAIKQRSLSDEQ